MQECLRKYGRLHSRLNIVPNPVRWKTITIYLELFRIMMNNTELALVEQQLKLMSLKEQHASSATEAVY